MAAFAECPFLQIGRARFGGVFDGSGPVRLFCCVGVGGRGGWMAGWLDGWMAGWLDGWMAGWLDGCRPPLLGLGRRAVDANHEGVVALVRLKRQLLLRLHLLPLHLLDLGSKDGGRLGR